MKKILFATLAGCILAAAHSSACAAEQLTLLGDANQNSKIELEDAALLLKSALGIAPLDESRLFELDMNNNGQLDLDDAAQVLKTSLKISPATYDKPLDYELVYEGIHAGGPDTFRVFDATYDAVAVLMDYNLPEAAATLGQLPQAQLEGKQIYIAAEPVCSTSASALQFSPIRYKESAKALHYTITESVELQDAPDHYYVRAMLLDPSDAVEKSSVSVQTSGRIALLPLVSVYDRQLCTGTTACSSYAEFQALPEAVRQALPQVDEAFFETQSLLLYKDLYNPSCETLTKFKLDIQEHPDSLALNIRQITRQLPHDVINPYTGLYTYVNPTELTCAILLPKSMLEDKQPEISLETIYMDGYEKAEHYKAVPISANGMPIEPGIIRDYLWTQVEEPDPFPFLPGNVNNYLEYEFFRMHIDPVNWTNLRAALAEFDYSQHDVAVIPFSPVPDHTINDDLTTVDGNLYTQEYQGKHYLLYSYGEGEPLKYNQLYLLLIPVRKTIAYIHQKELILSTMEEHVLHREETFTLLTP